MNCIAAGAVQKLLESLAQTQTPVATVSGITSDRDLKKLIKLGAACEKMNCIAAGAVQKLLESLAQTQTPVATVSGITSDRDLKKLIKLGFRREMKGRVMV